MTGAFIAYASEDRAQVEPIVQALKGHGLNVWWDRNIYAGEAFDREIELAIESAECIVVVWTEASVASSWVRAEATEGLHRGILVPIIIGDVRPPMPFRATQAILLDGPITDFSTIIRAVSRFVPGLEAGQGPPQDATIAIGSTAASTIDSSDDSTTANVRSHSRDGLIMLAATIIVVLVAGLAWRLSPPVEQVTPGMQRIVILPFEVRGSSDLDYLREGLVDLLAIRLDGIAGYHGIDAFTALTWAARTPGSSADPQLALRVAREVGAARFVMGAVVDAADAAVISATIYDLEANATSRAEVAYQGNAVEAIDELTRLLIASELSAPFESFSSMAALTTRSVEALKAYLEAERLFRSGDFRASVHQFQEAIRHDENFAIAWFKMSTAATFVDADLVLAAEARALELKDQLTMPQRELLEGGRLAGVGYIKEATTIINALTTAYPDNVEAWRMQGEIEFRLNVYSGHEPQDAAASFERILAIDPGDYWSRMYLVDIALLDTDAIKMRYHIEQLPQKTSADDSRRVIGFKQMANYIEGKQTASATARQIASNGALLRAFGWALRLGDPILINALQDELGLAVGATNPVIRLYKAAIDASQGNWMVATTQDWQTPEQWLSFAVLVALNESAPQSLKIKAVTWLQDWDPSADGLADCENPYIRAQGCNVVAQRAARQFYLFILLDQLDRTEQASAAREILFQLGRDSDSNSVVVAFAETAAGAHSLADGQLEGAMTHLRRGRVGVPFRAIASRPVTGLGLLYQPMLAWNRWLTGQTLIALERPQESNRWFRSVAQAGFWHLPWQAGLARARSDRSSSVTH